jgi:hypothetical protein
MLYCHGELRLQEEVESECDSNVRTTENLFCPSGTRSHIFGSLLSSVQLHKLINMGIV